MTINNFEVVPYPTFKTPQRMSRDFYSPGSLSQKRINNMKKALKLAIIGLAALTIGFTSIARAAQEKPNIVVIWGDDIGYWNISAYNQGMMGYETPNIDRIANEGVLFTDWYAQQSCTAGRAAFILGQHPFRTGLLTIGMPGSPHGISEEMPTLAT